MLRFDRQRILPVLIKRHMTATLLAELANITRQTAQRAIEGMPVSITVIGKIADALGVDAMEFLEGEKKVFNKKKVTITRDDGTKADVEISVDDSGKSFAVWGDDSDAQKAFAQYCAEYFSQKQKAAQ